MSPIAKGLLCRCPSCGKGRLYKGFLSVGDQCNNCGLDYAEADTGDGPAVFIILIVGFLVVTGALIVEIMYQPPYWVHAVLWLPATIILSLLLLRPFKALLIALQYHHQAKEGRRVE